MLYSLHFNSQYKDEAEEIKIDYNGLSKQFDYIKEHPNKRYNIQLNTPEIPEGFVDLLVFTINTAISYTICTPHIYVLKELLKKGYNTYFKYPVSDWETFNLLKDMGVSDIIIDGALCFEMSEINGAAIGLILRTSPTGFRNNLRNDDKSYPNSWYIRPEDIEQYNAYIDYVEFNDKEDTLFRIYKRKSFPHSIDTLFPQIKSKVENGLIPSTFVKHRLNCGQACLKPFHRCHLCNNEMQVITMLKTLAKKI